MEQLLPLLDGASLVSTGFTPEFEAVVLTIKGDKAALAILNSDLDSAAGIEFQPDSELLFARCRCEHFKMLSVMHHYLQIVLYRFIELFG